VTILSNFELVSTVNCRNTEELIIETVSEVLATTEVTVGLMTMSSRHLNNVNIAIIAQ